MVRSLLPVSVPVTSFSVGMFVLTDKKIRDRLDLKIFVDEDDDTRFIRRGKSSREPNLKVYWMMRFR